SPTRGGNAASRAVNTTSALQSLAIPCGHDPVRCLPAGPRCAFCGRCVGETDPGEERCDTVPVLFWQTGLRCGRNDGRTPPADQHRCRAHLHREN
ncbi:MAG: hypothetical protein WCF69_09335, partial [Mycobacterium sp.]